MCIDCSGVHRRLGTHISKVKSTTLDAWRMDRVQHMKGAGNVVANSTFEATLPDAKKIQSNVSEA